MGACASSPDATQPPSGPPVKYVEAPTIPSQRPSRRNNLPPSSVARGASTLSRKRSRRGAREPAARPLTNDEPKRRKSFRFNRGGNHRLDEETEQFPQDRLQDDGGSSVSEIQLARDRIHKLCHHTPGEKALSKQLKQKHRGKANSGPGREHVRLTLMLMQHEDWVGQPTSNKSEGNAPQEIGLLDDSYASFKKYRDELPVQERSFDSEVQEFDQFYSWKRNRIDERRLDVELNHAYNHFLSYESDKILELERDLFDQVKEWLEQGEASNSASSTSSAANFHTWQSESGRPGVTANDHQIISIASWLEGQPIENRTVEQYTNWKRVSDLYIPDISRKVFDEVMRQELEHLIIDDSSSKVTEDEFEEVLRCQQSRGENTSYNEFVTWQRNDSAAKTVGIIRVGQTNFDEIIRWQKTQSDPEVLADYNCFQARSSPASLDARNRILSWHRRRSENERDMQRQSTGLVPDDLDIYLEFKQPNAAETDERAPQMSLDGMRVDFVDTFIRWKRKRSPQLVEGGWTNGVNEYNEELVDAETFAEWRRASCRKLGSQFNAGDPIMQYVRWKRRKSRMTAEKNDITCQGHRSSLDEELLDLVAWQNSLPSSADEGVEGGEKNPETDFGIPEICDYLGWQRSVPAAKKKELLNEACNESDFLQFIVWQLERCVEIDDQNEVSKYTTDQREELIMEYLSWQRSRGKDERLKQKGDNSVTKDELSNFFSWRRSEQKKSVDHSGRPTCPSQLMGNVEEDMKEFVLRKQSTEKPASLECGADDEEKAISWLEESLSVSTKKKKSKRLYNNCCGDVSSCSFSAFELHESAVPKCDQITIGSADDSDDDASAWLQQSLSSLRKKKIRRKSENTDMATNKSSDKGVPRYVSTTRITAGNQGQAESSQTDETDISKCLEQDALDCKSSKTIKKKGHLSKVEDGPAIPVPKKWTIPLKKEPIKDRFFRLLNLEHRSEADTKEIQEIIMSNPELCQENFSFQGLSEDINPLSRLCIIHAPLEAVMMCYMAYPSAIKQFDLTGTPLHYAAKHATSADVISFLISKRPLMVQTLNMERLAPLHYACMSKADPEVIQLLLEHYPSAVQLHDKNGMTPLHLACANGSSLGIIEQLVHAFPQACISENSKGQTPLHIALEKFASFDIIEALVVSRFDAVKVTDDDGNLPLHIAAMTPSTIETVELLVDHFKDGRKTKNRAKQRPHDLAEIHRAEEHNILNLLSTVKK